MRKRGFYDMIALGRRSEGASAAFCKPENTGAQNTDFGLKRKTDFESETELEIWKRNWKTRKQNRKQIRIQK